MVFDTTAIKAAYTSAINAAITDPIDLQDALLTLEQLCTAWQAEYDAGGSHVQSYSIGGRSVSYRSKSDVSSGASSVGMLKRKLDGMLGRASSITLVDMSRGTSRGGVWL